MERSYKFRIYPTREQENCIQRTFGCCRFVYNHYLAQRMEEYQTTGKSPSRFQQDKDMTQLKRQLPWLAEADSTALQAALYDLDIAYRNFFRRIQNGEVPGYPKFKSKHSHRKSYKTKRVGSNIEVLNGKIKLPKLGLVKCRVSRAVEGRILSVTVSQEPSGRYYVSICCTDVEIPALPSTGAAVGVDLGIKALATASDGTVYPNSKNRSAREKQLRRLSRQLSRKKSGSSNREKARIRKARLEEHIANQRRDAIQKATTDLIRHNDVICIEDLKTKGMMQEHILAGAISDAAFYEFRRELEYKAAWYGRKVIVVDSFFPSSQLCHHCGYRNPDMKDLRVRDWVCPQCGTRHDRDVNAAINIRNEGMRSFA